MRLDEIKILNFCSCRLLTLPLSSFNPIIGYNNSGKSNILRSINWLLKKSVLPSQMFFDPTQPVIVEGKISNINLDVLPPNQQAQVAPYIQDNVLTVRRRQDEPSLPVGQIKLDVYNHDTAQWVPNPTGLDAAIGMLFPDPLYIHAMDDAADDISRVAAKNTIGLLLKYTLDQIRENNENALNLVLADLETVGAHLSGPRRLQELNELEAQASREISEFFPGLGLHLGIRPPDFDDLIKGATISLSDNQGDPRPFTAFGHGAQRAVQMALIKLLASQLQRRGGQGATTVLLIDEPELYLHPQAIEQLRDSLELLSQQDFQIVFSTHSPLMVGHDNVLNTSIVFKDGLGQTETRLKLATAAATLANHPHHADVIFSLQNSTYLLFSDKVLIAEGKTEKMILPDLYRVIVGRKISQDKICLIEGAGSGAVWHMMRILQEVGYTSKAVVDLDYMFKNAPRYGLIQNTDPDWLACRNWFSTNQATGGYFLGGDGFPCSSDGNGNRAALDPEAAFETMAVTMHAEVGRLAAQLRARGIWAWEKGAIEPYLGIPKNDTDRIAFVATIRANQNIDHATDPAQLSSLIAWLQ